jgi:hypothetical protein
MAGPLDGLPAEATVDPFASDTPHLGLLGGIQLYLLGIVLIPLRVVGVALCILLTNLAALLFSIGAPRCFRTPLPDQTGLSPHAHAHAHAHPLDICTCTGITVDVKRPQDIPLWRVRCVRAVAMVCSRALLLTLGFYYIDVKGRRALSSVSSLPTRVCDVVAWHGMR